MLNLDKYEQQLKLATMPDMPGRIVYKDTEWKPYIYKSKLRDEFGEK